ncbi:hypothetical protein A4X03_0g7923 [Tilletia caries]|uniref:Uncharacterized protein n=1 Tax=Tilletia caries TaxID=13290 RepID=A0A8T8SM62_9BASI|nr:hypothetical protein A4X03_0g7923 [Tilletia caries]CAD6949655.1 unnamed protein product [Tilletia caries]
MMCIALTSVSVLCNAQQIGGTRLASRLTDTSTASSACAGGSNRRRADRTTTADGLDLNLLNIDDDIDNDLDDDLDLGNDLEDDGNQGGGGGRAPGDQAANTAGKRGPRYAEECVADLDLHDFFFKAQELCHKHAISMTCVRQRLGFAVEGKGGQRPDAALDMVRAQ